jgi:iron complex transport system substrate-binding protein
MVSGARGVAGSLRDTGPTIVTGGPTRRNRIGPWPLLAGLLAMAMLAAPVARAQVPARIVSTSPSITETLFALGLGTRVVGVSTYCRFPAAVTMLPKVGTFLRPQPETIARLDPDLVFVHAGPHATAAQLAVLGIRTAVVDRGALASTLETIRQISAAAGVVATGRELIARIDRDLGRVRSAVAGRAPRKVLIVVGRRTGTLTDIVAAGPGSYLHDIIGVAGGTNVMASTTLDYPRISMETVISLAPDVIIDVGEMGESPGDSARRRQVTEGLWARQALVTAVRTGQLHAVTDDAFVVPGPRMVEVARLIAEWLHGVRLS